MLALFVASFVVKALRLSTNEPNATITHYNDYPELILSSREETCFVHLYNQIENMYAPEKIINNKVLLSIQNPTLSVGKIPSEDKKGRPLCR